ncbi:MAG: zinc metalloprotease HtpX [Thermoleophilia bacterium]
MAKRWYGRDRGLTARMGLTMFLLGLVYVVFMGVIIAMGAGTTAVVIVAAIVMLVQLFFSDKLALASMRAHVVTAEEQPQLHAIVDRLCQLTDLPKPRLAVAQTDLPNAFATGRSRKTATVCVTTGLMQDLEPHELEGVIAHELSHIANRDVVVMTVASFLATVAGLLIRMSAWGRVGRGRDNAAAAFFAVLLVSIVTYVVSYLLLRALSRYREYAADRGAAIMTGAPANLASALVKISGDMAKIPSKDLREAEGLNAFFIMPAVARGFSLSSLFATHPPVQKRIERLMAMQADIDAGPVAAA